MSNDLLDRFIGKWVRIWVLNSQHTHWGILKRLAEDDPMFKGVILLSPDPISMSYQRGNGDVYLPTAVIYAICAVEPDAYLPLSNP
jgi:hypothetical protein